MNKTLAFAILSIVFGSMSISAQSTSASTPNNLRVSALMGSSGLGMARLFQAPPDIGSTAVSFEAVGSVDVLLPKLISGDIDIGILPPNVAAKLYNLKPASIVVGAVVGNGMLSLVTGDESINSLTQLQGKTVYVAGQGATPEYVTRKLLAANALPASAVTLDFSIPPSEIAAALVGGKIEYAVLPEPFATVAVVNGSAAAKPIRRAMLFQKEWNRLGLGADFPMTVCVIRSDYAAKYPETVRKFLSSYRTSIEWTVQNPAEAGKAAEAAGLGLKAAIATKAIPACNFTYISAYDARPSVEALLSVFLAFAPESIGGKIPDQGFYFK